MVVCTKFSTKRFVTIDDELFTVHYIYKKYIYIWWTLNKQKRYDKRGDEKLKKKFGLNSIR